jgi:hypothetical protein
MRRWGVVLVLAYGIAAPGRASEGYREIHESYVYRVGQRVEIDFPTGQLLIEPATGPAIEVEIEAYCRWSSHCGLDDLRVVDRSNDSSVRLRIVAGGLLSGTGRELRATLRIPPRANVRVEMSIGELEIRGLEGDLRAELGIGEARVLATAARVGSVYLDAGIGDAHLSGAPAADRRPARSSRPLVVGGRVDWSGGDGETTLEVSVDIGEASVRLD